MKLICENIEDAKFLTETNAKGKKDYFIEGIFLQGNIVNRNGRKYATELLDREVTRYTQKYINENRAWGELGHPMGPNINLERVSHRIVELRRDGHNFMGKAKIVVDNDPGRIAMGLIENGGKLAVSSRGMGSLKERNGINEVQDDYYLATAADIVADPSAPDAFVRGIMENCDWFYAEDRGYYKLDQTEALREEMSKKSVRQLEEEKLQYFKRFMRSVSR